ncbi:hypothetical protein N825_09650 [Skermanella stibiiresistens SB22]|uniref:HTH araC/xylS-type domain-containing protein n=1 Tax=Skermanella stibiiresistens SB22 TaxID=1385369 RepID=W9GYZ7_9PROT|nr:helix-turn-helix transcriptional regulator [Skermanella stibiiresistens]EWY37836.1 hypothetical protein N825_09650 [Skermanella stibiiresistens SB22]
MTASIAPSILETDAPLRELLPLLAQHDGGVARAEVGAVAIVSAPLAQRLREVPVLKHCLVAVLDGEKHIQWEGEGGKGTSVVPSGWFVALRAGERPNIANLPDPAGRAYRAFAMVFDRETLTVPHPVAGRKAGAGHVVLEPGADLTQSFIHAVGGLLSPRLSVEVARHRMAEVVLALAERGVGWSAADAEGPIQKIRLMIAARPELPWTAADAARLLEVSEATLRRRLAAEGTCFREILAERRLSHGLALLQTSRAGIVEVAHACGYDSPSRFSSRFRERFGMPPSEVRGGWNSGAVSEAGRELSGSGARSGRGPG